MRILILFFLAFSLLFAQEYSGVQEDIDVNYKRVIREKKKVIIPEIVGLKVEDQKKLFDRSSKTYVEFPIQSETNPTIVIKTPANQMIQSDHWRIISCSDFGEAFDLKYARIKKMKAIVKTIFKNGNNEIIHEYNGEFNSDGIDLIPILLDNVDIHAGHSDRSRNTVKYFLIEIYIQDVFRKEKKNLCVSEILPFDS